MYAIVETGGKQYRVTKDSKFIVEKLPVNPGEEIKLDKVLMIGDGEVRIGTPYVEGASVLVEVLSQDRRRKVLVYKRRRRKDSKTMHGHRQDCTILRVKDIAA